ncbi:MAG: XRE family transcriptional regulator [Clostridia bacterium]|nr:XRE family transcriptional regulator [Clostridia bacterium]
MQANMEEIGARIASLREDWGITMQEMAKATGRDVAEYQAMESGQRDLSFTFLYKCADKLKVDVSELLTGESPHLGGYSITRKGKGLDIARDQSFEYLYKAANFKNKLAEPFFVTLPFSEEDLEKEIHLSNHKGQEIDYIINGKMRFAYEGGATEDLAEGDLIMYDSGKGHGMIALDGEPCKFIAIVIRPQDSKVAD